MNYSNVRFNFRRAAPPCTSRREQAVPAFQSLNVVRGSCYESRQEERRQTRGEVGPSVAARTPCHHGSRTREAVYCRRGGKWLQLLLHTSYIGLPFLKRNIDLFRLLIRQGICASVKTGDYLRIDPDAGTVEINPAPGSRAPGSRQSNANRSLGSPKANGPAAGSQVSAAPYSMFSS